ncbi:MAG TPA: two-component regulator propeller domain-containing protein [Terracidiphilus sp.]|jgi:ligand-binding sensor domain-containing protein/signal transduction histidine kinase
MYEPHQARLSHHPETRRGHAIAATAATCAVAVCLALACSAAFATAPTGFTRKVWQTQDGLPEQTVQAFAQTPDHYLWIGTTGGLLRFDGSRLTVYDDENTPELRENSVFSLMVSRDGSLWIGTEGGGLVRYAAGRFHAFGARDGLSDGFVRALLQDRNGTIWVGTDNGLLRLVGERFERVDGVEGTPAIAVHAIAEDHLGRLWAGGSRLLSFDRGIVREYSLPGESSQNRVKSILETGDGTIWVGTVSGLHRLRPGSSAFERVPGVQGTVRVLRQTSDGMLWIGMIGGGIRSVGGYDSITLTAADTLPSNTVLNIFEDDERNIWIGTQAGMVRLTRTPVRIALLPQTVDSDFGTIYADRDGAIWVVSTDVFRIRDGIVRPYRFPGLGDVSVRNVFRDRAGALWIGTDGDGIIRLADKKMMRMTTKDGLTNNFVRAMLQSRDGSMWIATDEGLSHWTQRGFTNYRMRDGLSYFSTRALLEDRNGDIWVGTDRGLNRIHAGAFVHDAATEGLSQKKVWAIHQDQDGGLWFGTRNDGLYRWKQGRLAHFTTDQGLASNSIYQVIEDLRGGFWISGPNGISLLSRRELDAAADHPERRVSVTFYGISNEVGAAQIYGGRQPSGCVDAQGNVWFPTNRGPVHILSDSSQPVAPQVAIAEVLVNGRPVAADHPVVLNPGNGRLEVAYEPILLRSQDRVRFRYQLKGFDANWIDSATRRVATYTNLPPGKYIFQVAAFEGSSTLGASQASLEIVQKPLFYRTPWFIAICVVSLAAAILGIYRFRLWQIKMRFEAVLDERGRLAREMHDTVIQGCASVSALIEALSSLLKQEDRLTQNLVEHARTQIRATIDEAREAVWNLRRNKAAQSSFGTALQGMAEQIAKEFGIPVTCDMTGKPFVLNQFATHELLMMVREALYNAVLHAKPGKIEIRAAFARNDLTLEVRDDGMGFDPAALGTHQDHHYGLVGMRERVQSVGGRFKLESAAGKGTEVLIQIPRKISMAQSAMLGA